MSGYLHELYIDDEYGEQSESNRRKNTITEFDKSLEKQNFKKEKIWTRKNKETKDNVTLPTYIRNYIHHPENKKNTKYNDEELRQSIEGLKDLLLKLNKERISKQESVEKAADAI